MNFNNKNNYIKLPTHEPESLPKITNHYSLKYEEEKIILDIKRDLLIFNIIISLIIVMLVVFASIKLTDKKDKKKNNYRSITYEQIFQKKIHEKYIISCINGELLNKPNLTNLLNPKISIIISVYNKEKYILRILRSIQNQNFENIEIIFADDSSEDNSINLIEEQRKYDSRIKLLKHNKNVGTLINRNDGAKEAKGEYLLFIDCDDLLLNNILNITYNIAKKEDLDIVQFRAFWGKNLINCYKYDVYGFKHNTKILYQPDLSNLMYYEYPDKILPTEYNLWGKLIKKKVFISILQVIDKYYLEQHMTLHEDGMLIFILFKIAKNYLYLDEFGMFYSRNNDSTLSGLRRDNNVDKTVRDSFLYLKFMFEYTGQNKKEKDIAVYQFKFILQQFESIFYKIRTGFDFIYDIIIMYLNCDYIDVDDKEIIRKIMYNFEKHEKDIQKNKTIKK